MGLFGNLIDSVKENVEKDRQQKEKEREYVRNSEASKAICEFIVDLFQKGNPAYKWIKENNKIGLSPQVNFNTVSLTYMQPGDGKSFSGIKPKDIEVSQYSFQEIFEWYGLETCGYKQLDTKTERKELEYMIGSAIEQLPHMKLTCGYTVKMFQ